MGYTRKLTNISFYSNLKMTYAFSNRPDFKYVVLDWRAEYDRPTDIPHKPQYIWKVGFGVISTNGRVRLYDSGTCMLVKVKILNVLYNNNNNNNKNKESIASTFRVLKNHSEAHHYMYVAW